MNDLFIQLGTSNTLGTKLTGIAEGETIIKNGSGVYVGKAINNIDNTSDLNKQISNPTQSALDLKSDANIDSDNSIDEILELNGGTGTSTTGVSVGDYGWNNLGNIPNNPALDVGELARASFNVVGGFRIVIDLGSDKDLATIKYINYIQANLGGTDRGVGTCQIYTADSVWTPSTTYQDATGLGAAIFDGELDIATNASDEKTIALSSITTAQYIIIDVVDNKGNANYCGLRSVWGETGTDTYNLTIGSDKVVSTTINGSVDGSNITLAEEKENKINYPMPVAKKYVNANPKNKILATNFDEGSGGWTFSGTGSVTHNVLPTDSFLGAGSIRVTALNDNTVNTIKRTLSSSIDLSVKRVARLRLLVNSVDNIDKDNEGLQLRLYSGVGDYVDLNMSKRAFKRCSATEFRYIDISFADGVTDNLAETGTVDYSAITDIELRVTGRVGVGAYVIFDELIFHQSGLDKAKIVIQWDDGHSTLPSVIMPAMSKYGLVGEIGMIADVFKGIATGGTTDRNFFYNAQNNGWSIANHGKTYTGWNDATTLSELEVEFFGGNSNHQENGFYNNDIFIYPQGETNDPINGVKDLISKYSLCARLTGDLSAATNQWPCAEPHRLYSIALRDTTSLAQAKNAVDQAIAEKSILVFYCHYLTTGAAGGVTWNDSDFDELLTYIKTAIDAGTADNTTTGNLFRNIDVFDETIVTFP